jgi:hypothetical protein
MPGPVPQPNRQARPGRDLAWTDLPAAGNPSPTPDLPAGHGLRAHGKRKWARLWAMPASTQWGEHEFDQALRLCQLDDLWQRDRDMKVLPELRFLEKELGLTPKARKELRWRIVADGAVVEENGVKLAEPRRLRVVDDQAAV